MYRPSDRPRRPNGTFRPVVFTNIHGVDRTSPRPAVLENPERGHRRPNNRPEQQIAKTPQQAGRHSRAGSHLLSPPPSPNASRATIAGGGYHDCNARCCGGEISRKELAESMQKEALKDLPRTGMTRHDYAVFFRKMTALKEYGPG
jgi:hypothetical protein